MNAIEAKRPKSTPSVAEQKIVPEREPKNSFIRFIGHHQEAFDQLSFLTSDLREEEEGWRKSATFDQLAQGLLEIIDAVDMSSGRVNALGARDKERYFGRLKRDIAKRVFEERKALNLSDFIINIPKYKAQMRKEAKDTEEAIEALNSFSRDYHNAVGGIATSLREIRWELSGEFRAYLQQDYTHLSDFAAFLSEKEHAASRDAIRPFLVGIAKEEQEAIKNSKKGAIGEVSEQWIEWVSSGSRFEVLSEWLRWLISDGRAVGETQKGEVIVNVDRDLVQWLAFALKLASKINPDIDSYDDVTEDMVVKIMSAMDDFSIWPDKLRDGYVRFGVSKIASSTREIRSLLSEFYHAPFHSAQGGVIFDSGISQGGKRKHQTPAKKASLPVIEDTSVKEVSKPYDLGILVRVGSRNQVYIMTEEEADQYILKQAKKIARKEPTLIGDIRQLVDAARKDQYANTIGLKTITWQRMEVDHKGLAFRSFDPRKRIGLELINKFLYDYRLVYAVDVANRVVIVEGLYEHDKYLSRFNISE